MQEQMQQGNKVSTVSYRSLKCAELAGTPGMKLSMSDQALFTCKLLFRFSYLGKWDFFFFPWSISRLQFAFIVPEFGTLIY